MASGVQATTPPAANLAVILLTGGTLLLGLSLVSAYIGYIFQEVKRRPAYLIRSVITSSETLREKLHLAE